MKYWLKINPPNAPSPAETEQDLGTAKVMMSRLGVQVLEAGLGIGGTYWLVVSDTASSIAALRAKLGAFNTLVEHVEPVTHAAQGRALGKQIPLFH